MISGHTLIGLLYDRRYQEAGWMLEVLSIALIAIPFRVAQLCYLALGLPKLYTLPIAIRVVVLFVLAPIGFYFFGLSGALVGVVGGYLSSIPVILVYNVRHNLFDLRKELLMLTAVPGGMLLAESFNLAAKHWQH